MEMEKWSSIKLNGTVMKIVRIAWRRGRRRGKGWKDLATEVRINKNGGGAEPRAWSYVSGKKTRRVDAILGSVNDVCSLNRRRI